MTKKRSEKPASATSTQAKSATTAGKSAQAGLAVAEPASRTAASGGKAGPTALDRLVGILNLEQLEQNLFRGRSPDNGWQRVYGGQVLGQALMAAQGTVDGAKSAHSLHGYFLVGGDPKHPIVYEVEHVRDGASFATRRVKALQHGRQIFLMTCSFHVQEEGYSHQLPMPDVPPPESLPSSAELMRRLVDKLPESMRGYWSGDLPMDMRPVDISRYLSREPRVPLQMIWLRTNGSLPDNPALHRAILAYTSDFTLLDTALIAHGKLLFDTDIQLASLDHAQWFHRPFRVDDWLLYVQDSPNAGGSRGFCRGNIFDRKGVLVASVTQEGLMRQRDSAYLLK